MRWTRWLGVAARLVVGGVWIVAGWIKLGDPTENVRAVRAYDLLPEALVPLVGHALPVLELVVGVCLVLGVLTRWAAAVSAVMLVAFVVGIASAWARGMSIECGCFGGGGGPAEGASDKYPWEIARDVGLLTLSLLLVWRPRTPWSVDERLLPAPPDAPTVLTDPQGPAGDGTGKRADRARARAQAAAIRHEAEAQALRRRNGLVTVVGLGLLALVVAIGAGVQSSRDTTGLETRDPAGVVERYALPAGDLDSPEVVVDVYEDFMCPFCGEFEVMSEPVVAAYDGQPVQFRYHVLSFLDRASSTDYSTRATNALAVVLDTAGPEVAKAFHDELFARQPEEGGPGLSDEELVGIAVDAGADEDEVAGPIERRVFRQWVRNATDAASRAGVNSTPTVLVDGERLEPADIATMVADLQARVDAALQP